MPNQKSKLSDTEMMSIVHKLLPRSVIKGGNTDELSTCI